MDFGKDITTEELLEQLDFFSGWEEKYSYIIELGKNLPSLTQAAYTDENRVKGCQSQVWMVHQQQAGRFLFCADSDALIVKGLLAIILTAYNHQTAKAILAFDMDKYFDQLDLLNHISPIRGNGLRAMVGTIRDVASASLDDHAIATA